jgi:hypothetical protein
MGGLPDRGKLMIGSVGVSLAALFYAVLGLVALARPQRLLADFGIVVGGRDGYNEIRAVYGGFPLAVAGLLLLAQFGSTNLREGILLSLAVASLGMAVGRIVSAIMDGGIGRHPAIFIGIEILLSLGIAIGLFS